MNYPNVQLFVDGKWRPAASGKTIPVLNPATEEAVGNVAHAERPTSTRRWRLPRGGSRPGASFRPMSAPR